MAKGRIPKLHEVPDMAKIKKHIDGRLHKVRKIEEHDKKVHKGKIEKIAKTKKIPVEKAKHLVKHYWIKTGIPGFDELIESGIPKGASVLVAGGCGTGKTIFCLQTLAHAASHGEKCLYLSFEEPEEHLKQHMEDFGWNWEDLEKKGVLKIVRKEPFELANNIEAMLAKVRGELLIDINEVLGIIPKGFSPNRVVIDSLSAIGSAFAGKEEGYRLFIEQLFRYFESISTTTFLVSETEQIPTKYSPTGVEEFLADGVIVLYNIKKDDVRTTAIEVLKMRGARINKKIVPFQIISGKGIEVYPSEIVFAEV